MISDRAFAVGLARITAATNSTVPPEKASVFFDALRDKCDDETWLRFCAASVSAGAWRFFPTVAEIIDAMYEFGRGRPPLPIHDVVRRLLDERADAGEDRPRDWLAARRERLNEH